MASRLAATLNQRLPILAGVCKSSVDFTVHSVPHCSKSVKKLKGKRRSASRRLLLGLGASFWAQFMTMSASDRIGGRFFMASARQRGASSPVEEVSFFAELGFWVFLDFDFWWWLVLFWMDIVWGFWVWDLMSLEWLCSCRRICFELWVSDNGVYVLSKANQIPWCWIRVFEWGGLMSLKGFEFCSFWYLGVWDFGIRFILNACSEINLAHVCCSFSWLFFTSLPDLNFP